MNYDEHSYSYDDNDGASFGNDGASFGNDEASFGSYNGNRGDDSHSVYELTTTYNDNAHYFPFDDDSISLAQNRPSTEYDSVSLSDDDNSVTNVITVSSISNNKSCDKKHESYKKSD